jgi:hypothetical protein
MAAQASESHGLALRCRYEEALRERNVIDFDDLLGYAVALLQEDANVRRRLQIKFRCASGMLGCERRFVPGLAGTCSAGCTLAPC